MNEKELIRAAFLARKNAYAPYSGYQVGAALLTDDDQLFTGCNVENASYGATCCAERTAIFKAVSEGNHKIKAIAISGGKGSELNMAYPCGICRQVLREFSDPKSLRVLVGTSSEEFTAHTLEELLPESFGPEALG